MEEIMAFLLTGHFVELRILINCRVWKLLFIYGSRSKIWLNKKLFHFCHTNPLHTLVSLLFTTMFLKVRKVGPIIDDAPPECHCDSFRCILRAREENQKWLCCTHLPTYPPTHSISPSMLSSFCLISEALNHKLNQQLVVAQQRMRGNFSFALGLQLGFEACGWSVNIRCKSGTWLFIS